MEAAHPDNAGEVVGLRDWNPEELFGSVRSEFVVVLGVLMLVFLSSHLLHVFRCSALPESLVTVLLGSVLGVILWASPLAGGKYSNLDPVVFGMVMKWLLNLFALPVIIFEAGWSLRLRDFISQFFFIMLFALVGTILSIVVVAYLTVWTSSWHGVSSLRTAFAYASLICSVDPVSTLATFNHLNVDPLLFILVFGESLINDAVAITLFEALNESADDNIVALARSMTRNLCGSIGMGLVLAMLFILLLRCTRMGHSPAQAILFIFLSCFFTFSIAENFGFSGIIAELFFSIVMGVFASPHLSSDGNALISFLLRQASSLADAMIFLFCGVLVVFVITEKAHGLVFGLIMSVICVIARSVVVVPLALLSNGVKTLVGRFLPKERELMITWKHMFMIWHSGLRGGVSIVLVMQLGDWVNADDRPGWNTKERLTNGTFFLVVLYLIVFGSSAGSCLRALGLPLGDQVPPGSTLYTRRDKSGWGMRFWTALRRAVLGPVLVGERKYTRDVGEGSVLMDVISEADDVFTRVTSEPSRAGSVGLRSSCPAEDGFRRSTMISLFNNDDPARLANCEPIWQDVQEAVGRRSLGSVELAGPQDLGQPVMPACSEA